MKRRQVSTAAIELVKAFEGYRRYSARLPDGRWTVGYGHTLTAREGVQVSEPDAEALLIYDLMKAGGLVSDLVFAPLGQNQFDALAAFVLGVGEESFRSSSVLRLINAGQPLEAAQAMEAWRMAEFQGEQVVADGLIRRRAAERMLFLTPADGFVAAPAAVLKPSLDEAAAFAHPVDLRVHNVGDALAVGAREADSQEDLPMDYPPAEAEQQSLAATTPAEAQSSAGEPLYVIPGFNEAAPSDPKPRFHPTLTQLLGACAVGIGFLAVSFFSAIKASSAVGVSGWFALAAIAGLAGAITLFSALYLILNRLDGDA